MSAISVNKPLFHLCLNGRVTVKGQTPVGCRPAFCPEGVIVAQNTAGLYHVQFKDGNRRWFTGEELCGLSNGGT